MQFHIEMNNTNINQRHFAMGRHIWNLQTKPGEEQRRRSGESELILMELAGLMENALKISPCKNPVNEQGQPDILPVYDITDIQSYYKSDNQV